MINEKRQADEAEGNMKTHESKYKYINHTDFLRNISTDHRIRIDASSSVIKFGCLYHYVNLRDGQSQPLFKITPL